MKYILQIILISLFCLTFISCAKEDDILKLWQGLGYYSRARNLHHTAKDIEIPANNTLTLDKPINLESNDILRVYASPNPDSSSTDMEAFASILEVS